MVTLGKTWNFVGEKWRLWSMYQKIQYVYLLSKCTKCCHWGVEVHLSYIQNSRFYRLNPPEIIPRNLVPICGQCPYYWIRYVVVTNFRLSGMEWQCPCIFCIAWSMFLVSLHTLTHWGWVTQICVFNTRLFSLHNTLNYAIHRACLRMVWLTDVYRNLTSLWIYL